jgi:menaquinone-dependent protoporphyrinogen oxidase
MRVLIAVASRHGSTHEIAEAIGRELDEQGVQTTLIDAEREVRVDVGSFDGVIVGSAIYMGRWLAGAVEFVDEHSAQLGRVPVWLFSSGPLGATDPQPQTELSDLAGMLELTGARAHRVFVGKLDKHELGFGERLAVKLVKAPEGDFRDWPAIREWADEIAHELTSLPSRSNNALSQA